MHTRERMAVSQAVVALVAVVLVGAAAGLYLLSGGSPSIATSTSTSSSTTKVLTHSTTSVASTLSTSYHSGTTTITASQTTTSSTIPPPPPPNPVLFGVQIEPGAISNTIPADTLVWTTWTMNSSAGIGWVTTAFAVSAQNANSYVVAAYYINGRLASNLTTAVTPFSMGNGSSTSGGTMYVNVPSASNHALPAGTVVSLAIFSPDPVKAYFNDTAGVQTNEATLSPGSGLPAQLPSSTSPMPSTLEIWATELGP
jgi:hypothetical protein